MMAHYREQFKEMMKIQEDFLSDDDKKKKNTFSIFKVFVKMPGMSR